MVYTYLQLLNTKSPVVLSRQASTVYMDSQRWFLDWFLDHVLNITWLVIRLIIYVNPVLFLSWKMSFHTNDTVAKYFEMRFCSH